jgi:sugar lactone lactonase YvrE
MFQKLTRMIWYRKRPRKQPISSKQTLRFEQLEDRNAPAVATFVGGVLSIDFRATGAAFEDISLYHNQTSLTLIARAGTISGTTTILPGELTRISVTASGNSTGQSLGIDGMSGTSFTLSGGFSCTGVDRIAILRPISVTETAGISIDVGPHLGGGDGVTVGGGGSLATANGDISIIGRAPIQGDHGVLINSGVFAGGGGRVVVSGTGSTQKNNSIGVKVAGEISSVSGDVSVTGASGGIGATAYGVWLENRGKISAGGAGTVTVNATGSPTAAAVFLSGPSPAISSAAGTITVNGALIGKTPLFTSPTSATFVAGQANSFPFVTGAVPAATVTSTAPFPDGLTLSASGVLSGSPALGTGGTYTRTMVADNGPVTNQTFRLTINESPTITSPNSVSVLLNKELPFNVTAFGFPAPTFTRTGPLPPGMSFNGAGRLSGAPSQLGVFPISITASNGIGSTATQVLTIVVNQSPAITSPATGTFGVNNPGSFTVTASGVPTPTISISGTLPAGLTFANGVLSGTPAEGTVGSYPLTISASNGFGVPATQAFTLVISRSTPIAVSGLTDLIFDSSRQLVYMPTSGGLLQRFDIHSGRFLAPFNVNGTQGDISPDNQNLYLTGPTVGSNGSLLKVNLDTGLTTSIDIPLVSGESPLYDFAIASNGLGVLTVFAQNGNTFVRTIDLATGAVVNRVQGKNARSVVRSADRSKLLLDERFSFPASVLTYSASQDSFTKLDRIPGVGFTPGAVSRDGSLMAIKQQNSLAVFTDGFQAVETLGNLNGGFAFSPTADLFVAAKAGSTEFFVYDTTTWKVKYRIPAEHTIAGADYTVGKITFSDDGSRFYLATATGARQYFMPPSSGPAARFTADDVPRFIRQGNSVTFTLSAKDLVGLPATGYLGTVQFATPGDPLSVMPQPYTFSAADQGSHNFTVTFKSVGTQSLVISDSTSGISLTTAGIIVHAAGDTSLLPIPNSKDLIFDNTRNRLYVTTDQGKIERYDLATETLLPPLAVTETAFNGADITPDGQFLYAPDSAPNLVGSILRKINLDDGTVTKIPFNENARDIGIGNNGKAVLGGAFGVLTLDLSNDSITKLSTPVLRDALITRSADRSQLLVQYPNTDGGDYSFFTSETNSFSSAKQADAFVKIGTVNRDGTLAALRVLKTAVIFDTNSRAVAQIPNAYGGIAFSPTEDLFFAVDTDTGKILAYDTNTWRVKYQIPASGATEAFAYGVGVIAFNREGTRLFQVSTKGVRQFNLPQSTRSAASISVDVSSRYFQQGATQSVVVTMRDPAGNVATNYRGTVTFTVPTDGAATLPASYTFTAADAGTREFQITLRTTGTHLLKVTDSAATLTSSSIAMQVHAPGLTSVLPITDARDLIFDATRNWLYATTNRGMIERYDITSESLLAPLPVAFTPLLGGDISPDGRYLYVAESERNAVEAVIRKVDLLTGAVTLLSYDRLDRGGPWDIAIASNGKALIDGAPSGGQSTLRTLTVGTDIISALGRTVGEGTQIVRPDDRSRLFLVEKLLTSYNPTTDSLSPVVGSDQLQMRFVETNRNASLLAIAQIQSTVILNGVTGNVERTLAGKTGTLVFDPNFDFLYLADEATSTIYKYNLSTWTVLASIPIGENFTNLGQFANGVMAISSDSSRIFLRTSSGIRQYVVGSVPVVSSISQNQGPATGGTVVTLTGDNFLGTTSVSFGGVAATFTIDSPTQITAIIPPHDAGTFDIVVTNSVGSSIASAASRFTFIKVETTIAWATPADIVYGTPLGSAQLNATANAPGTFTYSLPAGTVLHAGQAQAVTVTFTPLHPGQSTSAQRTIYMNVKPAPLIIRANNITFIGSYNFLPSPSASYIGLVNNDTPAVIPNVVLKVQPKPPTRIGSILIPPRSPSILGPGSYTITVSGGLNADYIITYVSGTLEVRAN